MAQHTANPLQLQWSRQPDGSFVIQMVATFPGPRGEIRAIPVRSWVLTKDEEERLGQALHHGLIIADKIPAGNGHA